MFVRKHTVPIATSKTTAILVVKAFDVDAIPSSSTFIDGRKCSSLSIAVDKDEESINVLDDADE